MSPYDITINTNAGSAASSWVTNLSGGPQVWTNDPANIIRPVNQPSRLLWDSVLSTNGPSTTDIINEVDSSSGYESYAYSELQSSLNRSADLPFARLLLSSVATNGAELDLTMSVNANDSGTPFFAFDDHSFGLVPLLRIMPDGNLSYIRKLQYSWPLTNALPGQVLASDGGTPQQVYWTNLSSGGGSFVTNAITTNTPAGMTNVIVSVINNNFGYQTNFATTNTSAGLTNAIVSLDLWKTNVLEGGIQWSNQNAGVAKFGSFGDGTFASGATNGGGSIAAKIEGATAIGDAFGANSVILAEDTGNFASGNALNGGTIHADGAGAFALGQAKNANSLIHSAWSGTLAFGDAENGGTIVSDFAGGIAMGNAAGGTIYAGGQGAFVVGQAFGDVSARLQATSSGDFAHGLADTGGTNWAIGGGAMTSGDAYLGGLLKAGSAGAHAFGYVKSTNSQIFAVNSGDTAFGLAFSNGVIRTSDPLVQAQISGGNTAIGYANNGTNYSFGWGCFVGGMATNKGFNSSTGVVSFTYGQNVGNEPVGGFAFAYGRGFTNRTDSTFNVGWFPTASLILGTNVIQEAVDTGGRISPRRAVAKPVTLTTNVATTICTITLPTSLSTLGCKVYATTKIKNATDWGYVTEEFTWGAGNKAGTVTTKVASPAQTDTDGSGGASVATTWTATVSGTTISLNNKAVTSGIAATTTTCIYRIEMDADDAIVVTPQ